MNPLAQLISSQVRAEIFQLLFDGSQVAIHLREVQRKSGLAVSTIQKELQNLKALDLITSRKDGNRLYIQANFEHPLYLTICQLVEKTSGIPSQLGETLRKLTGINCAFIFGSLAKGKLKAHSDIDLIVIGEIGLRGLAPKLKILTDKLGREINPHIYTREMWRQKLKKNDHFIKSILKEEKIILIGNLDDVG